jgi:carboxyl-terminal processing protease
MPQSAYMLVLVLLFLLSSLVASEGRADPAAPAQKQEQEQEQEKAPKKEKEEDVYELQKLLVDTLDQVERSYVKDISRRELVEAAIRGLLRELDPYSDYIDPEELKQFQTTVDAEFGGIGIQVTIEAGQLKVMSPLVGTPAYRAGLIAGDHIVEIDGKSTAHITIDEAVRRLKGEPETSVTLTIIHPGRTARETVTLKREVIHIETVLGDRRKPDDSWDFMLDKAHGIGYIRLTGFSRDTASELEKALEELREQKFHALILDLRFNPGGLLTSAIEISDLFISSGRIVSTKGRNAGERVWEAQKEGTFEGFPMVVLVNRYTASASEIVSACLQDHKRAVIMGERTWGKGSVQNVIPLEEQRSALKLTTASYRRPNGHNIHRFPDAKESDEWGVMPNKGYELRLDDRQMYALIEDRRRRDIVLPKETATAVAAAAAEKSPEKAPAAAESKQPSSQAPSEPQKTGDATTSPASPPASAAPTDPKSPVPTEKPSPTPVEKPAEKPAFVDAQLRMAIDYLTTELAKAK